MQGREGSGGDDEGKGREDMDKPPPKATCILTIIENEKWVSSFPGNVSARRTVCWGQMHGLPAGFLLSPPWQLAGAAVAVVGIYLSLLSLIRILPRHDPTTPFFSFYACCSVVFSFLG